MKALLLLPLLSAAALGQNQAPGPEQASDNRADIESPVAIRFGADHWSEVDLDDSQGAYRLFATHLRTPLAGRRGERFTWDIEFQGEFIDFNIQNSPTPLVEDRELWRLGLNYNLLYTPQNSPWKGYFNLNTALNSDFEDGISSDALRLRAIAGALYEKSPTMTWAFGVMYQENFESIPLFPFIGFDWRPTESTRLSLLGPRLDFTYMPTDDWSVGLFAQGQSRNWNVRSAGQSRDFEVNSARAGVHLNYRIAPKLWLTAESGMTVGNSLEILSTSGSSLYEEEAETGYFVRLGCRIPF